MSIFLNPEDVADLTGRKSKSRQVEQLRIMGIAFYVNAAGRPIVTRAAVEGQGSDRPVKPKKWQPKGFEG